MAADMHIHIQDETLSDKDMTEFSRGNPQGSEFTRLYSLVAKVPNIWIGEVSWLKASFLEDNETFIPSAVQKIWELCKDFPIVTEELITEVANALKSNKGAKYYNVTEPIKVRKFLKKYIGKKVFTISW